MGVGNNELVAGLAVAHASDRDMVGCAVFPYLQFSNSWQAVHITNWPETVTVGPLPARCTGGVRKQRYRACAAGIAACRLPGPWQASQPTTGRATIRAARKRDIVAVPGRVMAILSTSGYSQVVGFLCCSGFPRRSVRMPGRQPVCRLRLMATRAGVQARRRRGRRTAPPRLPVGIVSVLDPQPATTAESASRHRRTNSPFASFSLLHSLLPPSSKSIA